MEVTQSCAHKIGCFRVEHYLGRLLLFGRTQFAVPKDNDLLLEHVLVYLYLVVVLINGLFVPRLGIIVFLVVNNLILLSSDYALVFNSLSCFVRDSRPQAQEFIEIRLASIPELIHIWTEGEYELSVLVSNVVV